MSLWEREIRRLATDFCIDEKEVTGIILTVKSIVVPNGKKVNDYYYDKAYARLRDRIFKI